MGKSFAILFSVLLLLAATTVNASIIGFTCDDDGDGAIVMNDGSITLTPVGDEYELTMDGVQNWYPAHVLGDFTTDTELDPIVRIIEDVQNDTTFAWTDYHITIGMTKDFSFVTSGLLAPAGWTAVVSSVLAGQTMPNGGTGWVGTIDYYQSAGDAIAIGDVGTFGFKVSFLGGVAFCTEQIPTPEPATIGLLGLGAMGLLRRRKA